MKVLVNGGINLSELDGWWAEAYTPDVGWAIGDGKEHGDDPAWDATEANALYELLERQVVPEFYNRSEKGIPVNWLERIRKSMSQLTPRFSANRSVREYTEKYYLPLSANYQARAADKGKTGKQIVEWFNDLQQKWSTLQFGEVEVKTEGDKHIFDIQVYLNDLDPKAVVVELYAEGIDGGPPVRQKLEPVQMKTETHKPHVYQTTVSASRSATDYTARAIPNFPGLSVPLETALILWQH
jgi:starch phosphorylase